MTRKILLLFLLIGFAFSAKAQLSDLHYLPPLKQGQNNAGIQEQAVYLSTPEPTNFIVNVYRGTNNTPIANFTISNVNSAEYTLSNGDNNITLVDNANTGIVLNNSGLRFEAPSGNQFYVNYRGSSAAQSASLTAKGRAALGTKFKWGGVPNLGLHISKSNTLGIMATEDNTTINLFGYDPGCEFRVGNNRAGITANNYQITLDANESFVFETYIGTSPTQAHEDGWIGASIVSDKNIVISNGAMNFGRQAGATNRDAGIDQPVPEDRLGKEYVFVRGNGNADGSTEFPLLIAIDDNTQIFINGSALPITTINNGEYFQVPSTFYSSNTVGANMLIQTTKDVYAYQCLAGSSSVFTQGLNFVAPVNCLLPDLLDNIPDIRNIAGTTVTGGLTIIAAVNTPDANISVNDGNGPVTLPPSSPVAGSNDWKTFYIPNLNGDVSANSTGPMAIGFFGFNGARGVAGYFSGFDTLPEVNLEIRGGSGCFVGSEIFESTGNFDAYQWFEDGVAIPGANNPNFAPQGAGSFFLRGTRGPCTFDSNVIQALFCDPDIIINKTVDKPEIMEGETATFTIHVRNLGAGPVTNFQITDNIPAGLTLLSSFTITGDFNGSIWNIGTLNGGETAELELLVQGDEIDIFPLVSITNTATHTQDQIDNNITEDNESSSIIVHNDFDNDGVRDITDLDDDNDGIFDADECGGINICFEAIVNESFEDPIIPNASFRILSENNVPGWFTTATDGQIEIWSNNFLGVPAFDGNQFVELNATQNSALYQNLCLTPGTVMNWSVRHRGRSGEDVMQVRIGADLASATVQQTITDDKFAWGLHSGTYTVPADQNNTIFIFEAVSTATNDLSIGNFIDDIKITIANVPLCADSDNDGFPDNLDLDSDDDGCSDANEFYRDENADGGDGDEFGTGTPVVNPNGTVIGASYNTVFAPEILLGNTTEDLSGADINGQDVSLGQTFEYVLRFQNTGNDNAVNYTIRDVLPNNVTHNNIDISNAPGTTYTFDLATRTFNFNIPDDLLKVGDPEYSIRIEVSTTANCSDFVAACSTTLENLAFSTYQGVLNTATFTDENGSNSITGCLRTPEVASNSILNDLAGCNEARPVQLCGNDATLSAGAGFTTYNWVIDTNNNGQVDNTDTVLNDGDPDNDPTTQVITNIGNYIVEKISDGSCPNQVERITVERFGTTQTNPIISYMNQANSDANDDNDIQGNTLTCPIDGNLLPQIFLCGANDEVTLQLGITDALSIDWEKLDETSCSDLSPNCANTNGSCVWNVVETDNNFTLTESGEFRVVIRYQNGCPSTFFFNVFKNELDVQYNSTDILCDTPGNIRVTNVSSGFGFRLVDATNDNIIIPFSANNGPNFDINTSGIYRVEVMQLNPSDKTPIDGTCLFATEDIGIQERNFSVGLSTNSADCNALGTITIQALNAQPNYTYELRLDDGSNGGLGTLVRSEPALNSNSHTFSNVNPEDYIVITTTQDGCLDSQQITVDRIPELTLTAVTSEHITCNSGIATVTPNGGFPDPDYEIAIWSKDGVELYNSPSDIPDSELQTTFNFLFRDSVDQGDYEFIVIDDNDCFAISNTITIEDFGTPTITATDSGIICSGSATATLNVTVTGGIAPYQYSLDGGANYQNTNTFFNLAAGIYSITVMDSSGNAASPNCLETTEYEIIQPFRLTASAAIIEDASCNPAGALVRIVNPNGGQSPYEFSFNGGNNFSTIDTQNLLPGNHQLALRDALGCIFDMDISIPTSTTAPSFSQDIVYDCNGLGTITISPSNATDFTYSYSLDGIVNTPANNNVFSDIADGSHTIDIGYSSAITPDQSTLIFESFGAGSTTQIAEVGPDYCYEPQDGTVVNCNLGPAGILVDGEYTVTNFVTNPIPAYRNPNDHTGLTDGRFFAINPSNNLAGSNSIIWSRRNLDVLPNRDITISIWAYNLRQVGFAGNNPEVEIQLLDAGGNVINSSITAEIPKNNNADDWHNRTVTFNPGANTIVDIVFRSNQVSDDGNELILDDIQATQVPEICETTTDFVVQVEDNQEFNVNLLGTTDPTCNGSADGSIRFEVSNFDALTGIEYSIDGGVNWITSLVSPIDTAANLSAGNFTVNVRRVNDTSCTTDITATLNEPLAIIANASITDVLSCNNTGATITANASNGLPLYQYQLEITDDADLTAPYTNIVSTLTAYQNSPIFNAVPQSNAGQSYVIRVRDSNGCEDVIDAAIIVDGPQTIVFDLTPTDCYSGNNDGAIVVNVTDGNEGYQFRIDNGPWLTPTPSTDTTFTFNGLSNGTYNIDVRDQLGCPIAPATQTATINAELIAIVDIQDLSACNDGSITVNATGGNGVLLYAIVPANTSPSGLYSTSNTLTITEAMATANPSGYDIYVQDNNGAPGVCLFSEEDIILNPVAQLTVTALGTDPECFDGLGLIDVTVAGGTIPYTYTLVDLSPADGIDYGKSNSNISSATLTFNGIGVGDYEINITDTNGCTVASTTITITNAIEINADISPVLPANCASTLVSDFGFQFFNITTPIGNPGTVEYSNNGGTTWQTSPELRGTAANPTFSGTQVFPSIRVEVSPGVYCQRDFDRYIIPFPLDDLDITLSAIVVGCNDLRVTVEGSEGNPIPGYEYTYTDDPANFNTFSANPGVWTAPLPSGNSHTFQNIDPTTPQNPFLELLVPGRTYIFYVRDGSGCVRQSNVNVNEIPLVDLPIEITSDITPTCFGVATGEITFTITPDNTFPNFRWEIYELGNTTAIETSGGNVPFVSSITTTTPLGEGEYFIEVTQIEADNITEACKGASENIFLRELAPITATATNIRDISCNLPGLISITNISGGGGTPYTYEVSGPAGFSALTGTTDNPVEIPVNSPAGAYTVTIYDQFSCPLTLNTVSMTLAPNPTLSVTQDNCASPISITATGSSAAGNLRYAIVTAGNPAPTNYEDNGGIFNSVTPGSYDVYVIDGNGCTAIHNSFVVDPVLSASAQLTKIIDCTTSPDATINIEILDGSGNYEYSITNTVGAPAVTQTAVPSLNFDYETAIAGDYTITIFDTNTPSSALCNREFVINIPTRIEPIIDPAILSTNITCIGENDGTITISTTNSTAAPYSFEITALDGATVSIAPTNTTATTATFTGLSATTTAAGYVVTVTGDITTNNCSVTSSPILIAEPNGITVTMDTPVEFGCTTGNSENNASLTVLNAVGGSNNFVRYQFFNDLDLVNPLQEGTNTTYIETNPAGGNYTINVIDDNGCVGTTSASIAPFNQLVSATVFVDGPISCSDNLENIRIDVDGSITDYILTNPGDYEFRLLPSGTPQTSNLFRDLPIGNHTFAVRNTTTDCEITVNHSVIDPNTFDVTIEKLTDAICFGDEGSIRLTFSDATYSGRFSYDIFNTNNTPADRSDDGAAILSMSAQNIGPTGIINVPAGNYLVEVTQDDSPSCAQIRSFNITTPSTALGIGTITTTDVGCSNDIGSASINPTGGQAPYEITLTNSTNNTTVTVPEVNNHLFQNLSAGQFTVVITDALGCSETFTNAFELLLPDPITGTISATTLTCQGDNEASVSFSLNPRNISTNYRYVLNTFNDAAGTNLLQSSANQSTAIFNNLGAGFYNIIVVDDISCVHNTAIVEIVDPVETVAFLVTSAPQSCQTGAELVLSAAGGTAPYQWSLDGNNFNPLNETSGVNTHLFQNVTDGVYQYFIRDNFNCISVISNEVRINPIEELTVTLDTSAAVLNCNNESNAVIFAVADGGLGNYQYGLFSDANLVNQIRPYQGSEIFADLPQGTYYINVLSEDCTITSEEVNVVNPPALDINHTPRDVSCNGEDDGGVTIDAQGGSGTYQYAISPNLRQFSNDNTFENLTEGDYTVFVQDSKGCFEIIVFTIEEPDPLTIALTPTPEICAENRDGLISVLIEGGTAPYSTAIGSNNDADFVENRVTFDNLEGGDYFIFVKDANGCTKQDLIRVESGANLNASIEVIYECSGDTPDNSLSVIFEDESVTNDVLYALDSTDPADLVLDPNFENLSPGDHFIYLAHANGCSKTVNFEVEAFEPLELTLEQVDLNEITANALGGKKGYTYYFDNENNGNDNVFHIQRTDTYSVRVVDENGCEATASIFIEFIDIEIPNFFTPDGDGQNDTWIPRNITQFPDIFIKIYDRYGRELYRIKDNQDGWDGFYEKANLPTGDYWYIIKLNGEDDEREFFGHLTLYR